jgi:hypothetical protein
MTKQEITSELFSRLQKIKYNLTIAAEEKRKINEVIALLNPELIGRESKSGALKEIMKEIGTLINQIK